MADVSAAAVAAARATVERNGIADSVTVYHSDGWEGVPASEYGRSRLLVANLPHYSISAAGRPACGGTLGCDEGHALHAAFYASAGLFLSADGSLVAIESRMGSAPSQHFAHWKASGLELIEVTVAPMPFLSPPGTLWTAWLAPINAQWAEWRRAGPPEGAFEYDSQAPWVRLVREPCRVEWAPNDDGVGLAYAGSRCPRRDLSLDYPLYFRDLSDQQPPKRPASLDAAHRPDPLDARIRHSSGIERDVLCRLGGAPHGMDFAALLANVRPLLVRNVLADGAFGATRSVKWQFGKGGLSSAPGMSPETLRWARPLVEAFAAPRADLFVLNVLAVPCGAEVAGHYDDTIIGERTGVRVSVLYVHLPEAGTWSGGELRAYRSRAAALSGDSPVCEAFPVVGASMHFRGDLFHGIAPLDCSPAVPTQERISVVLEQYSMVDFPLVVSVGVGGGTRVEDLHFSSSDSSADLLASATAFAEKHGLTSGSGCEGTTCVADMIAKRMKEQVAARAQAFGRGSDV